MIAVLDRRSTAVAEDFRPTATAMVAEVELKNILACIDI